MKYSFEDIKDKVVIVTGSGQGIGRDIAEHFADYGAKIVITDIHEDTAQATAEEIAKKGVDTHSVVCDVSNFEQVKNMVDNTVEKWGKIDILVNNAGITMDNFFIRMKPEQWNKVIDINLNGVYNCTYAAVGVMRKVKSGNIVNISSISAQGNPGQANYSASKAGVIGFTKTLGRELASMGIRVNAVAPGFIKTAMTDKIPEEIRERMLKGIPLGRPGYPEDVANAVLFLASDLSSYVTAHVLDVNGGISGL
ncbi:MAG: 3-oxoacyl-ACP reductase FabG [Spirochaetia bacterium]|nr:3-oxoacyl-ACP reductase FabG [Spirochaetia bacterium]